MIRATLGIWINYATTFAFQIIFAARYGSSAAANAFVITSGLLFGLSAVATTSIQSVLVPRLVDPTGQLSGKALRTMIVLTAAAGLVLATIAALPNASARLLAHHVHLGISDLAEPLRIACLFTFLQVIAGVLIVIAIARGRRFMPAVAPAFPSIAACVLLALQPRTSLPSLFGALAAGSALEIAMLGLTFGRLQISRRMDASLGFLTLATAAQLSLLTLIPPVERVLASLHSPQGAAHYNYAIRSLAIVAQLLIGGVILSVLGDWSTLGETHAVRKVRQSLASVSVWCGVFFVFAASLALVAGHALVRLVYEHGSFSRADSHAVTRLLLLGLPGFCAEGPILVLSQGLLASRRNWPAIIIGLAYGTLRLGLVFAFAARAGVDGVAIGYSLSTVSILVVEIVVVARLGLLGRESVLALRAGAVIACGTLGGAGICVALDGVIPVVAQLVTVVGVFAVLIAISRPQVEWRARNA
ncbi:MAG: hypothetical protein H0W90_09785 [Actinobacteria bacterium]|nr:hypothetical protein [Actinomycetota bacterium]